MKCTDVPATALASIRIKDVNEDDVWAWLAGASAMLRAANSEIPLLTYAIKH